MDTGANATTLEGSSYRRVIVFGDIHGDLDILAQSLAERGLIRYDGNPEALILLIREGIEAPHNPGLESLVIPQAEPVTLVMVGDLVDRYPHAYHVLQFVSKIRWEHFGIRLITLLGNHDLMNLMFFSNPYEVHQLMTEAGRPKEEVMQYIGSMGLTESLHSFYDLHSEELLDLQSRFYQAGEIEAPISPQASVVLRYPTSLAWLSEEHPIHEIGVRTGRNVDADPEFAPEGLLAYYEGLVDALASDLPPSLTENRPETLNALVQNVYEILGGIAERQGERNWWRVFWKSGDRWFGYSPEINGFNAFVRQIGPDAHQLLPIDWRIISLVWRKHYGNYYRRTKILHLEDDTLFTHGGISPLAMFDPLFFGGLYWPSEGRFRPISSLAQVSLESIIDRSNRLAAQVIENALNDYSFSRMCAAELLDQMGNWRGSSEGLPEFGGPLWSDFEFLRSRIEDPAQERLHQLYMDFAQATGIRRIVCGHTVFMSWIRPDLRFQKIDALEALGLEYICVDNGCSRAYRWHKPVPTGIELMIESTVEPPEPYAELAPGLASLPAQSAGPGAMAPYPDDTYPGEGPVDTPIPMEPFDPNQAGYPPAPQHDVYPAYYAENLGPDGGELQEGSNPELYPYDGPPVMVEQEGMGYPGGMARGQYTFDGPPVVLRPENPEVLQPDNSGVLRPESQEMAGDMRQEFYPYEESPTIHETEGQEIAEGAQDLYSGEAPSTGAVPPNYYAPSNDGPESYPDDVAALETSNELGDPIPYDEEATTVSETGEMETYPESGQMDACPDPGNSDPGNSDAYSDPGNSDAYPEDKDDDEDESVPVTLVGKTAFDLDEKPTSNGTSPKDDARGDNKLRQRRRP